MRGMLIYEDRPIIAGWLKAIYIGAPLLTLALGLYFLTVDLWAAITMLAITVIDSFLFRFITPQSYQIYTDRLVIKLYGPFSKTVMFSDIKRVVPNPGLMAMSSGGIKFTTTNKNALVIERHAGMYVAISPKNLEMFMDQLEQAMKLSPATITERR